MTSDTKDRILPIALKFFLTKPFNEVTMSEILKESGLSKGGFYHHFESKEALFQEVIDKYLLGYLMSEVDNYINGEMTLSFREGIPLYLGSMLKLAEMRLKEIDLKPEDVNLYSFMFDMMKYYKGCNDVINKFHVKETNLLKSIIDNAIKTGEIRKDINSSSLANHIHTLMHGLSVLSVIDENFESINERIKNLFNDLYSLVKI